MKRLMKIVSDLSDFQVEVTKENKEHVILSKISAHGREGKEDAFFIADLSNIARKLQLWKEELPRVEPHYAVKCNEDPAVLRLLAYLGTGFDCASKSEIQKVLDLGVAPSRIVYANPCKQASFIKHAAHNKVSMMTFDNEAELHKIKAFYPDAELIVRILPPGNIEAQCQLGMKFGCTVKEAGSLLAKAKELQLNVIGVSFHVGSGCLEADAFARAVLLARAVFDIGAQLGFDFKLLDIGGGFPGQDSAKISFKEICQLLRPALDEHFPTDSGVRIISEPGRFFVASAFTVVVNVIAKRVVARDGKGYSEAPTANDEPAFMYYVNDGVYGSFNCLLFDHAEVKPTVLEVHEEPAYTSSIWGPTCDGLDCIRSEVQLPELHVGSWLAFHDMGAYTMCAASTFNGMPRPKVYYTMKHPICLPSTLHPAMQELLTEESAAHHLLLDMELPPGLLQPEPISILVADQ